MSFTFHQMFLSSSSSTISHNEHMKNESNFAKKSENILEPKKSLSNDSATNKLAFYINAKTEEDVNNKNSSSSSSYYSILSKLKLTDLFSTTPNIISSTRLFLSPILLFTISNNYNVFSALLFSSLAITDYLDGKIARSNNSKSQSGIVLDPLADKCLIFSTLVPLALLHHIPFSLMGLIVGKDLIMIKAASNILMQSTTNNKENILDAISQEKITPSQISKFNSAFNFFVCALILSELMIKKDFQSLNHSELFVLMSLTNILTLLSAANKARPDLLKNALAFLG